MKYPILCLLVLSLSPLTAMADVRGPARIPTRKVEQKDIPVEELAHSFFYHYSGSRDVLTPLISADGVERISPSIASHQREMDDPHRQAAKLHRICDDLQRSEAGAGFVAVVAAAEQREQQEQRAAAKRILLLLNDDDRAVLENYLDIEFRAGYGRTRIDFETALASGAFGVERTAAIKSRACDLAAQASAAIANEGGAK